MLILLLGVFLFFLVIGTPIAFSLGIAGVAGFIVSDPDLTRVIPQRMYSGVDSFPLMAVPFFVLAGELMGTSGILRRLVRFAEVLVGHVYGGLAQVNIVASMIFAGISGSAIADASALGGALIPGMTKRYGNRNFAAAVTASAATIGPIIPPSIPMVVYAFAVGQVSIGGLFLAGVVPGLLMGFGMMVIAYVIARRRNYAPEGPRANLPTMLQALREAGWALIMPVIILGGILGGFFTSTEAAAVAVIYAVFVGAFVTRELKWVHINKALAHCVMVSAVVFFLVACSSIVSWILTSSMAPARMASGLREITTNPLVFLLIINIVLLIAGCLLDNIALMIMVAPILAPVAVQYGIDPLHFGFVFVLNSVIGLLTPPVGAVLFTVCGIAKAPLEKVARESLPFFLWQIAVLAIVTYIPFVATGLPQYFGYGR
ncbi:MAG: TRAP transporter large permease [Betaproteobacteria bacterium]